MALTTKKAVVILLQSDSINRCHSGTEGGGMDDAAVVAVPIPEGISETEVLGIAAK